MQDEKGRIVPTADTLWRVFNDNFSYLPPAHAVRRSHVSGGKLSEPRQSHRLQTRTAASIASRSHRYTGYRWISMKHRRRDPEAISSRSLLREIVDNFSDKRWKTRNTTSSINAAALFLCRKILTVFSRKQIVEESYLFVLRSSGSLSNLTRCDKFNVMINSIRRWRRDDTWSTKMAATPWSGPSKCTVLLYNAVLIITDVRKTRAKETLPLCY